MALGCLAKHLGGLEKSSPSDQLAVLKYSDERDQCYFAITHNEKNAAWASCRGKRALLSLHLRL
jgi:hypothetical protein